MDLKVVGRPIGRVEGPEKVAGRTVYTADVQLPGMLWGKCLRSPYAHARIISINTDKAKRVKGVAALLTGADLPSHRVGLSLQDTPLLAQGKVRFPAVLLTAILGFTALGIVVWIAVVQMTDLAPKMPIYQNNIQAKLHSVNDYVSVALSKVTRTAENIGQNLPQLEQAGSQRGTSESPYSVRVISSPASALQLLGGSFGSVFGVLGSTGMVIVLVVFFLIRREDLRDRFIRLAGTGQVTVTTQMLEDAGTRVSRYLSVLFLVNATFGIAVGIGLYLIGLPNAILWGILATSLRFIPYIVTLEKKVDILWEAHPELYG